MITHDQWCNFKASTLASLACFEKHTYTYTCTVNIMLIVILPVLLLRLFSFWCSYIAGLREMKRIWGTGVNCTAGRCAGSFSIRRISIRRTLTLTYNPNPRIGIRRIEIRRIERTPVRYSWRAAIIMSIIGTARSVTFQDVDALLMALDVYAKGYKSIVYSHQTWHSQWEVNRLTELQT